VRSNRHRRLSRADCGPRAPRTPWSRASTNSPRAPASKCCAGGNAVDAAVATGFALAVVYPQAGNLGGGGFLLLRNADGKVHFIDFREKAPAAATENMYLDAAGNVLPESNKESSVVGYKSIGVPGTVAGLIYAEKQYGKLSIEKVMAPAIKLARDGFRLATKTRKI
jgi:gamma-glutamyltranspeptidase / glutathione hydrolase